MPPYFKDGLRDVKYTIKSKGDEINYLFGEIIDPEGKNVTIYITNGLQDFMSLKNLTLSMKPTKSGVYSLQVELKDEDGSFSRSEFNIEIKIEDEKNI